MNVHGHLHNAATPPESQRINISVEQTEYRPVQLRLIRRLAALLVKGLAVRGGTTADQLKTLG